MSPIGSGNSTRRVAVLLCALIITLPAAAEPAGRIIFASANATIESDDGSSRAARTGMSLQPGDVLASNDGIIQAQFTDGGFFSVQRNSRLEIERYRFSGEEDGSESAIFRLLKGGLRAVSGIIGHRHSESYRLHTAFASIGIRGTAYSALVCQQDCRNPDGSRFEDGLHARTSQGTIFLENTAGTLDIPAGRAGYVPNELTVPVYSIFSPSFVRATPRNPTTKGDDSAAEDRGTAPATRGKARLRADPAIGKLTAVSTRSKKHGAFEDRGLVERWTRVSTLSSDGSHAGATGATASRTLADPMVIEPSVTSRTVATLPTARPVAIEAPAPKAVVGALSSAVRTPDLAQDPSGFRGQYPHYGDTAGLVPALQRVRSRSGIRNGSAR